MKKLRIGSGLLAGISVLHLCAGVSLADVQITTDRNDNDHANVAFKFKHVPTPLKNDAGSTAKFAVIDGEADAGGGTVSRLNDGGLPTEEDEPSANFFFAQGTDGGMVVADLKSVLEIKQVNTYSWHPNTRGPQVYQLYASDGSGEKFDAQPAKGKDLAACGWKLLAKVDTRGKDKTDVGGQYGVSISDSESSLGKFRYLLFVISRTEDDDDFGNTFYSEIDIVGKDDPAPVSAAASASTNSFKLHSSDGKCEITIQLVGADGLQGWAKDKLSPALAEWYPKIAAMLPSDGYEPPGHMTVILKPGRGVAATGGTRVTANSSWLQSEIDKQAVGSIIHEEVHVIQQYGRGRRNNPDAVQNPGWLVEGIADYIRFYKFEPQTHGAEVSRRGLERAKYDGSYRVTANFLNWVSENHAPEIVRKLNAAMREGKYSENIWKTETGKSLQELGQEWKSALEKKFQTDATPAASSSKKNQS